ncbi:MAG: M23 family metallopeptidase [Anaerolineae bacterium]|nr:M23 family metallopeptidase [Anaerolineae bacterium]
MLRKLFLVALLLTTIPLQAQTSSKPFILPMQDPPGASTWLLGQPYGNTIGAYLRGADWYEAGQRLHFGLDFSMECGTELVAMADGEIAFVDDLGFGSGPHNLLIRHANAGVIALYGHLLQRPALNPGDRVTQGQVVGLSGDPDVTCDSRPHLHLEIRSLDYFTTYNPVDYINANWHMLTSLGGFRYPLFQQDLDNARQWMSIDDQPPVQFGGRALNAYAATYPDWDEGLPPVNPLLAVAPAPLPENATFSIRRFGYDGCCAGAWWNPLDPTRLFVIDGAASQRAAIFEFSATDSGVFNLIGQAPPPLTSPDGTHQVARVNGLIAIRRLTDNLEWTVETEDTLPAFSTDNRLLMWQLVREPANPDAPVEIWISDADGANRRMVLAEPDISAQWLDESRLLITRRETITTTLRVLDTISGSDTVLGAGAWLRGLSIGPGGERLMFYLVYDDAASGIYSLRTQSGAQAERMPFFGAWRWRDADSVFYLPYTPDAAYHTLSHYDLASGANRSFVTDPFLVANGDWSVSPDGTRIVFLNALDRTLGLIELLPV